MVNTLNRLVEGIAAPRSLPLSGNKVEEAITMLKKKYSDELDIEDSMALKMFGMKDKPMHLCFCSWKMLRDLFTFDDRFQN
jgi:hypothetical protein